MLSPLRPRINLVFPPPSPHWVQQREEVHDCMIAAFATATGLPYEEVAELFGCPCDPDTGLPERTDTKGLSVLEVTAPLYLAGWQAVIVISTAAPEGVSQSLWLPSPDAVKGMLGSGPAVLMVRARDMAKAAYHALAWRDGMAIDCKNLLEVDMDSVTLLGAVLLSRR